MSAQLLERWVDRAACRDHDPEEFFAKDPSLELTERLRRLCLSCPVIAQCRAESRNHKYGFWAGEWRDEERRAQNRQQWQSTYQRSRALA